MATINWIGNAHDVKQISTITVANTWAAGDTATMTINGKDLIVTIGATGTATTEVATSLKEAWMSATRLDGTGTWAATSNCGGQEFGEFAEATASVSGSVVTIIANKAGVPFTLSVTETTAGSGTATGATSTAATGKEFWDNGDNWSGGSVPSTDDVVIFKDSDVSCRYGLQNGGKAVTIQQWMSYTGEIGLPAINRNGIPYYEYRQRYLRLDNTGAGTAIAHRFGLGKDGIGSSLINVKHSTSVCTPIIYNTGNPLTSRVGTKALNICCTANTSTINILGGSVDWSSQDSGTSAFVTIAQSAGDSRGVSGMVAASTITLNGGMMAIGGAIAIAAINVHGGTLLCENQTGTITALKIFPQGSVDYASSATISVLSSFGGAFDAGKSPGFTLTNAGFYPGSRYYDPAAATTIGSNAYLYFDFADFTLGNCETSSRIKFI
jgi:hypothetical protein